MQERKTKMRKDLEGNECPETLGEYLKMCKSIGGEDCRAVKMLEEQIEEENEDSVVVVSDEKMRQILMPLLTFG